MSENKSYQAIGRQKGTQEWRPILYSGMRFYSDAEGVHNLLQMTTFVAATFPQNEYKLEEITL